MRQRWPYLTDSEISILLKDLYPSSKYSAPFLRASDIYADHDFQCTSLMMSRAFASFNVTVYKTSFERNPSIHYFNEPRELGVYHGAEVQFLWHMNNYLDASQGEVELADYFMDSFDRFLHGQSALPHTFTSSDPLYTVLNVPVAEIKPVKESDDKIRKCQFWYKASTLRSFVEYSQFSIANL